MMLNLVSEAFRNAPVGCLKSDFSPLIFCPVSVKSLQDY